jgi:dihydrofolate synthase / folylpolyglutamate synthase
VIAYNHANTFPFRVIMFRTFEEAKNYLYSIPADFPTHGAFKYARGRHFASLSGDIQNSMPSIHIAGTSGKGSTAWIAHHLLAAHGYRSGLHVSPHTLDYRERMMVGTGFMSEETFLDHLHSFLPLLERMNASAYGRASYTEVSTMLAFHAFARERVDVAVIEVACGGLHDATNILDREDTIRVIGEIGYDHTHWLGETLREIMFQKAGIIHRGNRVISFAKEEEMQSILRVVCDTQG